MKESEHHLILRESYALMKSPLLNVAFLACLIITALSIGGWYGVSVRNPSEQTATVGAVLPDSGAPIVSEPMETAIVNLMGSKQMMLPFSDDVIISTSTTPNTIIVQPVFDGTPGQKFEYAIVPVVPVRQDVAPTSTHFAE